MPFNSELDFLIGEKNIDIEKIKFLRIKQSVEALFYVVVFFFAIVLLGTLSGKIDESDIKAKKIEAPQEIRKSYSYNGDLKPYEIFNGIAKNMGMMMKGEKLNTDLAAITLLREYRAGRLIDLVIDNRDMK